MIEQLQFVTIVVREQDEAAAWYIDKLGMEKRTDIPLGSSRWLTVALPGHRYPEIVLYMPTVAELGEEGYQKKLSQIGNASAWVFSVKDCKGTIETLRKKGVEIVAEPQVEWWGTMALIKDLYGNLFSLVEGREP